MLLGDNRNNYREFFFEVYQKVKDNEELTELEQIAAALIGQHPEYQSILENKEKNMESEFSAGLQDNPFMHLGMHMGIIEQLQTDKPAGIRDAYIELLEKKPDEHELQHQIMMIMGKCMQQAMQQNTAYNEQTYLDEIKNLLYT